MQVDGYGVWRDLSVEKLSSNMTVFYGRNEAGKTTLLDFIRTVLYGFSEQRRDRYLPPVHGGDPVGRLSIRAAAGKYLLHRTGNILEGINEPGNLFISTGDGQKQGPHILDGLLSGVDEAIFNNVFAVGLRELQELATLDKTDAADQIYKLTSGLDRVSLVDVMRELDSTRTNILGEPGGDSEIAQLIERHDQLRREIDDASGLSRRFSQLAEQGVRLDREVIAIEEETDELQAKAKLIEAAIIVRGPWSQRETIERQLAALPEIPSLPRDAIERLDRINTRLTERQAKVDQLAAQRTAIKRQADLLPINDRLQRSACRIDAMCEHAPWIESLESQISRLRSEAEGLETELEDDQQRLGLVEHSADLSKLSSQVLAMLKTPARSIRSENERLAQAKNEEKTARRDAEELDLEIESALSEFGNHDLQEALAEKGDLIAKLRRRIHLEERIERMARNRDELEEESQQLLEEQVLPFWQLAGLGVPFILGVAMLMGGVLCAMYYSQNMGFGLGVLGAAGIALTLAIKSMFERNAARDLDDCNRQLDLVERQLRAAKEERENIDGELPLGSGQLDRRLEEAELELTSMEDLLPIENRRAAAWKRVESAGERAKLAEAGVVDGKQAWRSALKRAGLPEQLTPSHISQLSRGRNEIAHKQVRSESRREEWEERRRELHALSERINNLLREVGLESESTAPRERLKVLQDAIFEQRQFVEQRESLKSQFRSVKRDQARFMSQLKRLREIRDAMFADARARDEDEYRRFVNLRDRHEQLTREHEELTQRIDGLLGIKYNEADVESAFDGNTSTSLERQLEELEAAIKTAETRQAAIYETRGATQQEMRSLGTNNSLAEAQFDLGCIQEQLNDAIERWQVMAASSLVLESIRDVYESQRQPETLGAASKYLNQLTDGKYQRIWTPLGDNVLRVDNKDGESLSLESLSCGTREAVFVSIRLALAAAYSKRGAVLPLVLDDVLVNFDSERSTLAAKVLASFAEEGHQVLMFTCHEHIMEIFSGVGVEVRELPRHNDSSPTSTRNSRRKITVVEPEPEPIIEPELPIIVEPDPVIVQALPEPEPEPIEEPEPEIEMEAGDPEPEEEPVLGDPEPDDEPMLGDPEPDEALEPEPILEVEVEEEEEEWVEEEPEPEAAPVMSSLLEMWWEDDDAADDESHRRDAPR